MSDDVLERVKMCVAEAGYDPTHILRPADPVTCDFDFVYPEIPVDVAWRAREVADSGKAQCRECWSASATGAGDGSRCTARFQGGRFVEDCGVGRD